MLIVLRDGKRFIGILRTFDQYGNMVLSETIERIYIYPYYAEEYLGLYIIRGENMLLYGEWDDDKDVAYLNRESLVDYMPRLDALSLASHGHMNTSATIHRPSVAGLAASHLVHGNPMVEGWKREEDGTAHEIKRENRGIEEN
jgi:small nuclear ribonucleoprotein (snRNP)-like protein